MSRVREPLVEPIPGYHLLKRLGRGGCGEVWECVAPGGLHKAIKFVFGNLQGLRADRAQALDELRAIDRVKAIRHPFLLSMDRVEQVGGELIIVSELADKNLHELMVEYQQAGLPGVPRDELLGYLREAAEVLDLMNLQHGLQHLDIKPRNLFLVSRHVKVADFGLVQSLSGGATARVEMGAVTPLYASPEVFLGRISSRSDQYSLAVSYQELLTGTLPHPGKNVRQLLLMHTRGEPDLAALPEADRPLVGRALAKEPDERYPSCQEFIEALAAAERGSVTLPVAALPPAARSADTVCNRSGDTDTPPVRPAPAVAGYRLVESLGSNPLADVWRVEGPDGRQRVLRLVYGLPGRDARTQEDAVARLRSLSHPLLVRSEVVQHEPGRLVLVGDLIEDSLRVRLQRCQADGLPGLPREELLNHLECAAEAIDYLYRQHGVHHLGLNPRNLLLDGGRLRLAEFGLAHLLWVPAGQGVAQRNARYAPPELFDGVVTRSTDQYSLAVIFQELSTGTHPFAGRTRHAAAGSRGAAPDPSALPEADREAIARALDPDPQRRWSNCSEMVTALRGAAARPSQGDRFLEVLRAARESPPEGPLAPADLGRSLRILLEGAGLEGADEAEEAPPVISDASLEHRFRAGLPVGAAREELDRFRRQWRAEAVRDDDAGMTFLVHTPTTFWRQWLGRKPALRVRVGLARVHARLATPIEVAVDIRPERCGAGKGRRLLEEVGVPLLENLRTQLLTHSEKRTQDRVLWPYPVQVRCAGPDGLLGPPVECRGKDISLGGIGFYLPHDIPTSKVSITLRTGGNPPTLTVPATLVRAHRCADGSYDVGALFRLAALRQSFPEIDLG